MSTFREDGAAALDWVANYLETINEHPGAVAGRAGRDPGRAPRLASRDGRAVFGSPPRPRSGPDAGHHALAEPALLRLLCDDRGRAGHPRRAPDRRAQPGGHPLARLSRAAGARGGDARLAASAARPARAAARPHRGHGLFGPDHGACSRSCCASGQESRRLLRAHALVHREGSAVARARPAHDSDRCRIRHAAGRSSICAMPAPLSPPWARRPRRRSIPSPPSPSEPPPKGHGSTSMRRMPEQPPCARSSATTSQAGSAQTRSASTRTSGSSPRWTAPCSSARRPDDLRRAFSLVPEYLRVDEDVVSLSEYASPLGRRFRALKLWATLRCFGREGLQAIIREHVRLAELFEEWVAARARVGDLCSAALLARVLPEGRQRRGERGDHAARERQRRDLPLAHEARRPLRASARDRQRAHDGGGRGSRVGRPASRGGALADAGRDRRRGRQSLHEPGDRPGVTGDLDVIGLAENDEAVEPRGSTRDHCFCLLGDSRKGGAVDRARRARPRSRTPHVRWGRGCHDHRTKHPLEPAGAQFRVGGWRPEGLRTPSCERGEDRFETSTDLGQLVDGGGRGRGESTACDDSARLEILQPRRQDVRAAAGKDAPSDRCSGEGRDGALGRRAGPTGRPRDRGRGRWGSMLLYAFTSDSPWLPV